MGSPIEIPIWKKSNLTIDEAVAYSGIGRDRIKNLIKTHGEEFVLRAGNKCLIKRKQFDAFIGSRKYV